MKKLFVTQNIKQQKNRTYAKAWNACNDCWIDTIENALTVEAYPFEQVQELVKLNQQFAQEIENLKKPQGEQIPVSKIPNDREYDAGFNAGYAEAIKNIPEYRKLADKLQRQQGKWYYSCDKGWECNKCHKIVKNMPIDDNKKATYNFCPNCGAKMSNSG